MTPEQLEREIAHQNAEVERFQITAKRYRRDGFESMARTYMKLARNAAYRVAALVAQRTPETVARMERERGLA